MDIPDHLYTQRCPYCSTVLVVDDRRPIEIGAETGRAFASLLCPADCGYLGAGHSWEVTYAEFVEFHGHAPDTLLLAGDPRLTPEPATDRVLDLNRVGPAEVPADAWSATCENRPSRWSKRLCGSPLSLDPTRVIVDEFTSTASIYYACPLCEGQPGRTYTLNLTPEQHHTVFGRTPEQYHPSTEYGPDDYDDGIVPDFQYSVWDTGTRANVFHFETLAEITASDDYDWRTMPAGVVTVKHWPTGVEWDGAAFYAAHQDVTDATYDPADLVDPGEYNAADYDEEED